LQTGIVVGPVGLRASGFSALDQPAYSDTPLPRWGGDADLMFVFDLASRGSTGFGGIAPYVFAGAGMTVKNDSLNTYDNRPLYVTGGWSYGAGVLVPLGNTIQAMGEVRYRPEGFFNTTASSRPARNEFRIGLSVRLGTSLRSSRARSDADARERQRRGARSVGGIILSSAGASAPASSGAAARVLPTAERYIGTPYRYGGTSPSGFDCSGFVQYVFAKHSVKLPRTSRQQARVGTALSTNVRALAPGDLVMFAESGKRISHVAIYAGHDQIIHSTSSGGGVRYDDLNSSRGRWFVEHMVAARRVVPDGRGIMLDLERLLDVKSLADTVLDLPDRAPRP
jgi:cell wall-associated NlpC family hydrolase